MSQIKINEVMITFQQSRIKNRPYSIEFVDSPDAQADNFVMYCTLEQIETLGQALIAFANTQR